MLIPRTIQIEIHVDQRRRSHVSFDSRHDPDPAATELHTENRSLSIFDAQQQSSNSYTSGKGGFSLFSRYPHKARLEKADRCSAVIGLLNTCRTKQGATLLKRWMQRPLSDNSAINDRHQSVAVFHRHENRVTSSQLGKLLKRMANGIHNILNRTERLDPNDWKVWKSLVDVSQLRSMVY